MSAKNRALNKASKKAKKKATIKARNADDDAEVARRLSAPKALKFNRLFKVIEISKPKKTLGEFTNKRDAKEYRDTLGIKTHKVSRGRDHWKGEQL